jgi:glycosyltransferase involved in cell wall biosynthesis
MKNIIFVTNSILVYGGELSLLEVLKHYKQKKDTSILVIVPEDGPFSNELRSNGIDYVIVKHYKWLSKTVWDKFSKNIIKEIVNIFAIKKLKRIVKNFETTAIYTNTITPNIGALVASQLNIPHIWHLREQLHEDIGTLFTCGTSKARALLKKSDVIICNSKSVLNYWQQLLGNSNFTVVYNGFDFKKANGILDNRFKHTIQKNLPINIAIISSIHPHKNQMVAIKALRKLINKGLKFRLKIYGEGNPAYIEMLKQLAVELDVESYIEWMGYVPDPFETLSDVALTIMCSKKEAFGRVIVESMGKGIPVIAPNSGGIPEIIVSGKTGILYEVGSDEELAKSIAELVENEDKYNCIAEQAYDDVIKRFSVSGYLANIDKVIERTIFSKTN